MRYEAISISLAGCILLTAPLTVVFGEDAYSLTRLGSQMNSDEIAALEKQVTQKPSDIDARVKLLGYYFLNGRQNPDSKSARLRHIEWLIANAPESDVLGLPYGQLNKILESEGYDRAKQAWLKVVRDSPENLKTLRNAASFFLLSERQLSEELLLKGKKLDASDPYWPGSLGRLYSLELMSMQQGAERQATAKKAFEQFELAYKSSEAIEQDSLLTSMAKSALEAGLTDEAKKIAGQMLESDATGWNRGNRIHHANIILGRIALAQGDMDEAKSRLLLAGKTSGSPQLNSFGPNMTLAKELLEQGETDVVLEYFELCKLFWDSPRRQLEEWTDDVKANRIPKFGANLAH